MYYELDRQLDSQLDLQLDPHENTELDWHEEYERTSTSYEALAHRHYV